MQLIDIGVNLTHGSFAGDREQVVQRAFAEGISHLILIGSDIADSREAIELCKKFPPCVATLGIHPHQATQFNGESVAEIVNLLERETTYVKVLGEMGLDFNRNYSPQDQQLEAFATQLALAASMQMPAYLHQRDAHGPFVAVLREYRDQIPRAVAHCFTGTRQELRNYLDLDLHIGITGWICDERRGEALRESVKDIPLDRLMLETDSPYLLPRTLEPKPKNRRNEPANLTAVLEMVAHCRNANPLHIAVATTRNATRFFDL